MIHDHDLGTNSHSVTTQCRNPRLAKSHEGLRQGIFGNVIGETSQENDRSLTLYRSQWVVAVPFVIFFPGFSDHLYSLVGWVLWQCTEEGKDLKKMESLSGSCILPWVQYSKDLEDICSYRKTCNAHKSKVKDKRTKELHTGFKSWWWTARRLMEADG